MDFFIDIGNSSLKWVLYSNQSLSGKQKIFYTVENIQQELSNHWHSIERPARIVIACVAGQNLLEDVVFYIRSLWPEAKIIIAETKAKAYGVTIAYAKAHKLGVDRWLGLLAARRFYKLPVCIASCGTAITVDVLTANGIHLGGMIAPGVRLMNQALKQGTQQLHFSEQSFKTGLANDTEAGIYNGIVFSIVGLIDHVMSSISAETDLLMTGGDAEHIARYIKRPLMLDENLVFKGMAVILES